MGPLWHQSARRDTACQQGRMLCHGKPYSSRQIIEQSKYHRSAILLSCKWLLRHKGRSFTSAKPGTQPGVTASCPIGGNNLFTGVIIQGPSYGTYPTVTVTTPRETPAYDIYIKYLQFIHSFYQSTCYLLIRGHLGLP